MHAKNKQTAIYMYVIFIHEYNKIHQLKYIYDQSKVFNEGRALQILYKLYITSNCFVYSFKFVSYKHIINV